MAKSENTRVSTDVLNEARVYCKSTGRILQRFIDDAVRHELTRVKPEPVEVIIEDQEDDVVISKGAGW